MPKIIIIGCGIGGATAALALHRAGFDVRVFERASAISEVGAGIGLLVNAMRVFKELAIDALIESRGQVFWSAELCQEDGSPLTSMTMRDIVGDDIPLGCAIHRAVLLSIILENLPKECITLGAECRGFTQDHQGVTVHFKEQKSERGDVVIGADGLHSIVRRTLFGDESFRYSGQTCFRGIAYQSMKDKETIKEVQGKGQRCSTIAIDEDRVYWWAALNAKREQKLDSKERQRFLIERFYHYPFGIADAIMNTDPHQIIQNDLIDRRARSTWTRGRITLLGDAAHPMVPNLGQGACTAIEDALVITQVLMKYPRDYRSALSAYEAARIKRTSMIARLSWLYGIPCLFKNDLAIAFRNTMMRMLPKSLVQSVFKPILGHHAQLNVFNR